MGNFAITQHLDSVDMHQYKHSGKNRKRYRDFHIVCTYCFDAGVRRFSNCKNSYHNQLEKDLRRVSNNNVGTQNSEATIRLQEKKM